MKTILLCGYRESHKQEAALGLERDGDGMTRIDRRILQLRALTGGAVVCVLAGAYADEQLREARQIEGTELAFDTSARCTLMSNLRSGARLTDGEAAYVLPVEIPPPPKALWTFLWNEYAKLGFQTPHGLLQAVTALGAPCHLGFPVLLTREGMDLLRRGSELDSLVDARWNSLHVKYAHDSVLEPTRKHL